MSGNRKALEKYKASDKFQASINGPLKDWQVAGLAILLFKGGIYWGPSGSWSQEGKNNLAPYFAAVANKPNLTAYLRNASNALDKSLDLQDELAAVHLALSNLIANMTSVQDWTYCGTLAPPTAAAVDQSE